jgi:hypothetical protein
LGQLWPNPPPLFPCRSPTEAQPDIPSIVFVLQLEAAAWRSRRRRSDEVMPATARRPEEGIRPLPLAPHPYPLLPLACRISPPSAPFLPVPETDTTAGRPMPLFDATPSEARVTQRSAVSSSSPPPMESTRSALVRRRRRHLPPWPKLAGVGAATADLPYLANASW